MTRKVLNHYLSPNSITVIFDSGSPLTVSSKHGLFDQIKQAIRTKNDEVLSDLFDLVARVKRVSKGKFMLMENEDGEEVVLLYNKPLPKAFSNLLIDMVNANVSTDHLEKFWKNCCRNPEPTSRDSLYDFIVYNGLTLTDDGCFIAYKGVKSNFTDSYSGKFDNSPGNKVTMNRSEVVLDRNATCAKGLHVASWNYASKWSEKTIEVKVDPADVVSVPRDYNGQKMRVCAYLVLGEISNKRDDILHPDTFITVDQKVEDNVEADPELDLDIEPEKDNTVKNDYNTSFRRFNLVTRRHDGGISIPRHFVSKLACNQVKVQKSGTLLLVKASDNKNDENVLSISKGNVRISQKRLEDAGITSDMVGVAYCDHHRIYPYIIISNHIK